jgi:excisionase family DNA binding protein
LTVKQAAGRLEVSQATVYSLVAAGKLRCVRIGNKRGVIRILDDHLAEYLKQAEPVAQQPPAPPAARRVILKHLDLS